MESRNVLDRMNIFDGSDAMYKNDTTFPGAAGPQNRGDDPSCGLLFFSLFFFWTHRFERVQKSRGYGGLFYGGFFRSKTPKMMSLRNKDFGVSWNMMDKFCFFRWKKDCKS